MDSHKLALFFAMVIGLAFADSFVQVYRYGVRDVFQNPSFPRVSTITDCVANATSCREYNARCLLDGYCCLCVCDPTFSTYSVAKGQCLADTVWLSGSSFRFVENGKILPNVHLHQLTDAKDLGEIVAFGASNRLENCEVVRSQSTYLPENQLEGWKPLEDLSKKLLFKLSHQKNGLVLKWIKNSTLHSKFQGLVIRLVIQCTIIKSTIVFKTWKNYNDKNFIGCLRPLENSTKTPMLTLHTCSVMTPSLCNGFCRALGRSLAVLRGGTKCFCGEFSQVKTWLRNGFSCFVPCPGDPSKLCGGKESYSAYRTMPEWPNDFEFSTKGSLNFVQYLCTAITEGKHFHYWNNTFFCSKKIGKPLKTTWLSKKRARFLGKRRCTKITEPSEPDYTSWKNNYLCVRKKEPLTFHWSNSGPIAGKECVQWLAEDPHGWNNNYLCADRPKRKEINATLFCPPAAFESVPITPLLNSTSHSPSPSVLLTTPSLSAISRTQSILYSSEPRLFLSIKNISKSSKRSGGDNLMALYVIIPLACILFGFFFGVLTLLHWKGKMARINLNASVSNFLNPACSTDQELENSEKQHYPQRKNRTDRLPSLPYEPEEPELPNETPNVAEVPSTTSSPNHRHPTLVDDEISPPENNVYETPVPCGCEDTPFDTSTESQWCELSVEEERDFIGSTGDTGNTEGNGDPGGIRRSPTYESIDNIMDTLYLEVLP